MRPISTLPRLCAGVALATLAPVAAAVAAPAAPDLDRATTHATTATPDPAASDSVPLYDDLGDLHHEITTESPEAQAYFDQGLRLQYAFNHAEAIRSYREALRHDPSCAMCWWGVALALGPNINAPMSPEAGAEAWAAVGKARELAGGAGDAERAYIEALSARYAEDGAAERAPLDSAYAKAMSGVAEAYPEDPDALALHAASLMNLSPWNYWTGPYDAREPRPDTPRILASLERAMELSADHPGACHYYIHAVEAAHPERAVPCAERLAELMPGAGHIVHMPGHIYIRVGRYADAVRANEHAVHADESYIQDQSPTGLYPTAYYPHNYHFMAFAATMAGMSEKALWASRQVAPKVPVEIAREVAFVQNILVLPQLTLLTFGRYDDVLEEPKPSEELVNATALYHFARGTALAATGRTVEAGTELEALRRLAEEKNAHEATPDDPAIVLAIGEHMLAGEIAVRDGDVDEGIRRLERAAALEDAMRYEEPPLWYAPVRHTLGRALVEAGRAGEAEARYREDLLRFPENGWALHGLMRSLEAQGRDGEAAEVAARFEEAWKEADVTLATAG